MTQTEFHHAKPVYESFDGWNERHLRLPVVRRAAHERAGLRPGARGDVGRRDLGRRGRTGSRADRAWCTGRGPSSSGPGGREHASSCPRRRSRRSTEVHAAPGNPGIGEVATLHPVDPMDGPAVAALATSIGADLVVIGPEAPLVAGVADAVRAAGVACFGPPVTRPGSRGPRPSPRRSWPPPACRPPGPAPARPPTRSPRRSTRSGPPTSSRTTRSPLARASWSPPTATRRSPTRPGAPGRGRGVPRRRSSPSSSSATAPWGDRRGRDRNR